MARFVQKEIRAKRSSNTTMKSSLFTLSAVLLALPFCSCSTSRSAVRGTAVGAVAGAVVAGPVGAVAGGAVGNAYGDDHGRRHR